MAIVRRIEGEEFDETLVLHHVNVVCVVRIPPQKHWSLAFGRKEYCYGIHLNSDPMLSVAPVDDNRCGFIVVCGCWEDRERNY